MFIYVYLSYLRCLSKLYKEVYLSYLRCLSKLYKEVYLFLSKCQFADYSYAECHFA